MKQTAACLPHAFLSSLEHPAFPRCPHTLARPPFPRHPHTCRLSTVRRADSIAVIVDGSVAEQGSHAELLELGGRYAQLINTAELGAYWVQAGVSDSSSSLDEGDAAPAGEQPAVAAAASS